MFSPSKAVLSMYLFNISRLALPLFWRFFFSFLPSSRFSYPIFQKTLSGWVFKDPNFNQNACCRFTPHPHRSTKHCSGCLYPIPKSEVVFEILSFLSFVFICIATIFSRLCKAKVWFIIRAMFLSQIRKQYGCRIFWMTKAVLSSHLHFTSTLSST